MLFVVVCWLPGLSTAETGSTHESAEGRSGQPSDPVFTAPGIAGGEYSSRSAQYKSGYSGKPIFGGPNSPQGQLEEDDRVKDPAFRFPAVDDAFQPWRNWKRGLNEKHGLQLSGHYSTLFQGLSDSITGEDYASSGVFRVVGSWTLTGRDTPDTGSLVVMIDNRHAFRSVSPSNLGSQAGYIGVTGTLYSDIGWSIVNLNWQQRFNDGNTGLLVGALRPQRLYEHPRLREPVDVILQPRHSFRPQRRLSGCKLGSRRRPLV